MSRKANNGKRSSSRDSRSIADKLEAIGLGIKFNRIQQNAQNPHSAPFRRTTVKDNYQDPIKDHVVYPAGENPEKDYTMVSTSNCTSLLALWLRTTWMK